MFYSENLSGRPVFFMALICSLLILSGCQLPGLTPEFREKENQTFTDSIGNDVGISPVYKDSARAEFAAANVALEAGHNDIAITQLLKLTSDSPELSSPWINLGIAYRNLGADDDALKAFKRALLSQPDNCEALNRLGIMAREAGDFETAEARYLSCLVNMPEFSEVHLNLGILYELYMGKYASALSQYRNYMAGLDEADRRVVGWIKDLERRQASMLATENY